MDNTCFNFRFIKERSATRPVTSFFDKKLLGAISDQLLGMEKMAATD